MSYILDALRRLEQDKERAKRGTNPVEAVLVPDLEAEERSERKRFGWVFVGLVVVVAVIAATYWITRRTLVSPGDHVREGKAPHLAAVRPGYDRLPPRPAPEAGPSSLRALPPLRERTVSPATHEAEVPASSSKPEATPHLTPFEAEPIPLRDEERRRPAVFTGEGAGQPAGQHDSVMFPDASEAEVIQRWRGSEIKINAIAYSRHRQNRFAVVNLKTVHEGDLFEDLVVAEIQEKGILFERAGKKYKVLLGRR